MITVTGKSSPTGTHYWRAWKAGSAWNTADQDYTASVGSQDPAELAIAATSNGAGVYTGSVPDDADFAELVKQVGGSPSLSADSVVWIWEPSGGDAPTAEETADAVWTRHGRTLDGDQRLVHETQQFEQRTIVRGNSYGSGARSLSFTRDAAAVWPTDLSDGWTWAFTAKKHSTNKNTDAPATFTGTVAVAVATGDDQQLDVTVLSSDISAALGDYNLAIRGTKTGAKNWDAVLGTLRVLDSAAA